MEYQDLVLDLVEEIIDETNRIHGINIESIKSPEERKKFAEMIAAQNDHIDNMSPEERANREAQERKAQNKRAEDYEKEKKSGLYDEEPLKKAS